MGAILLVVCEARFVEQLCAELIGQKTGTGSAIARHQAICAA